MDDFRPIPARLVYRVAASSLVGYPLLLCWDKGWLPKPQNDARVLLKDGRLLRCELADRTQRTMYLGLFEPRETRLIAELLASGDIFLDVGAHIGWFSTIAARCVGSTGKVIACEPYPTNAVRLRENLTQNNCTNVRVVEAAMGSQPGTLTLASHGDSGGVTALDWARDGQVDVSMMTIDEVVANVENIALMKVDVEGWEAHVLRGAATTLTRTENVLIEINRSALRKAGSSPEELFSLLRTAGFRTFQPVVEKGLRRFHSSVISNVLATRSKKLHGKPRLFGERS